MAVLQTANFLAESLRCRAARLTSNPLLHPALRLPTARTSSSLAANSHRSRSVRSELARVSRGPRGCSDSVRRMSSRLLRAAGGPRSMADVLVDDRAEHVLNFAEEIAVEAGDMIRRSSGKATQVESKEARSDLVTEVDRACEEMLHKKVSAAFPLHSWVGEETVTPEQLQRLDGQLAEDEWTWIVDPIDGTLNFVGGMPMSVVSLGVARGNQMEVGVVYNPFNNEMFHARRGQGAWLNGRPIRVAPAGTELEDSVASVGFPSKPEARAHMLEAIAAVAPHVRTVRALGTAALHMSYVASGRLGCFFEHNLKAWDIAAARLILEEAGGKVTDMDGNPLSLRGGSVLATNGSPLIHDRLLSLIRGDPSTPL